jgi:hypothetical protein
MKLRRIGWVVVSALCLVPVAQAGQRGASYASIRATMDYCERVNEPLRREYENFATVILKSLANVNDPGDYQAAYNSVSNALNAIPERVGRAQCEATLGLTPEHRDDDR